MIVLTILLLLAFFSFLSVVKMIVKIRSFNNYNEGYSNEETTITKFGDTRKISSKVGKYVDFDEKR